MKNFLRDLNKNAALLIMILPGAIWFLLFKYLPMFGVVIAFKDFRISPKGFWASIKKSEWVGFDNFKFLFSTNDAYLITRNTILYNSVFIFLGLIAAVAVAIALNEIINKSVKKVYQTCMFFPYFLSWVVVSYFVFSFLSTDRGVLNQFLGNFGVKRINWYFETKYWPGILVFMSLWKNTGYNSVVYLAAISGIDETYYEAAMIDGASRWKQIKNITIPMLKPLMIILTLMAIGRIFYADFGLFYQVPRESGILYPVTNVIDTYVFRGLMVTGDIGMSTAAGLYQSIVGFILVMLSNFTVKKIQSEYALF